MFIANIKEIKLLHRVSVIIPALNEEKNIAQTISFIQAFAPSNTEIVVVDNGSQDETVAIAESMGVLVIERPGVTIAALRNEGVRACSGGVLAFIDADVTTTKEWGEVLSLIRI